MSIAPVCGVRGDHAAIRVTHFCRSGRLLNHQLRHRTRFQPGSAILCVVSPFCPPRRPPNPPPPGHRRLRSYHRRPFLPPPPIPPPMPRPPPLISPTSSRLAHHFHCNCRFGRSSTTKRPCQVRFPKNSVLAGFAGADRGTAECLASKIDSRVSPSRPAGHRPAAFWAAALPWGKRLSARESTRTPIRCESQFVEKVCRRVCDAFSAGLCSSNLLSSGSDMMPLHDMKCWYAEKEPQFACFQSRSFS